MVGFCGRDEGLASLHPNQKEFDESFRMLKEARVGFFGNLGEYRQAEAPKASKLFRQVVGKPVETRRRRPRRGLRLTGLDASDDCSKTGDPDRAIFEFLGAEAPYRWPCKKLLPDAILGVRRRAAIEPFVEIECK